MVKEAGGIVNEIDLSQKKNIKVEKTIKNFLILIEQILLILGIKIELMEKIEVTITMEKKCRRKRRAVARRKFLKSVIVKADRL